MWHAKQAGRDTPLLVATHDEQPEPVAAPRPGETMQGRIVSTDAVGIVLRLGDGRTATVRFPEEAIGQLEVSQGRASPAGRALTFGGVGLVAGLAVAGAVSSTCEGWDCPLAAAALYVLTPALCLGGVVTRALSPAERWHAVPRDKRRVSLSRAGHHGVGVQVSLSF